jgi:Flp pilus assembly protein TadG
MMLRALSLGTARTRLRKRLGRRGTVAVEYAILLPAFLLLVLGGMDMGRLIWTQVTLDRFVQQAARCAVVTPATCGNAAAIETWAISTNYGLPMSGATYSLTTPTCGANVSVQLPFKFSAPLISPNMTLAASACYPVLP